MPKEESGIEGQEENLLSHPPLGTFYSEGFFLTTGEISEKRGKKKKKKSLGGKDLGGIPTGEKQDSPGGSGAKLCAPREATRCQDTEFDCEQQARPRTTPTS